MSKPLRITHTPTMTDTRLILGFTGWMDGGDVSTGAIDQFAIKLKAQPVAEIESEAFYIYNVPGTMEIAALFRPYTEIEDGIVTVYDEPQNIFYADETSNTLLFEGKEPNIAWKAYADAIFEMAGICNVTTILFAGSVAGTVPHTRPPRFHSTVSDPALKPWLEEHGVGFSNYKGPASFITYLQTECRRRGIQMASLVAEIPAYVQGRNVKAIEATCRLLAKLLELSVDLDDLRIAGDEFERRLSGIVHEREDLAKLIRRIEHDYDREALNSQEDELKDWFEKQDIRLD
jgi:predicted ATP-grasp superfamily ATP-dependent carboligase